MLANMNIQPELLKLKNLNPLQKLILGLIIDTLPIVIQMVGGCDKTCGQIGKLLGVSRARILKEFEILIKLNLIVSKKGDATRLTNVTQRLKELLN
jgi:DNA-binding MarR family transcriptional regulator